MIALEVRLGLTLPTICVGTDGVASFVLLEEYAEVTEFAEVFEEDFDTERLI